MIARNYDDMISRINLRSFQDATCVAVAAVMAGSGDLDILRRLRRLHGRRHDEANYGGHMAAHMAIGLLFMSGGQYALATTPLATACLFAATYPKFPMTPGDNSFHLQALRHLWVLAADNRCLVPRSVDTFQPTLVPVKLRLNSGSGGPAPAIVLTAPCLLPDFSTIRSIETEGTEFQKVVIDFVARGDLREQFKRAPMIFVMRNSISTAYQTPFEQGLARVVKADHSSRHISSITRAVRECLQMNYMEEEMETSEGPHHLRNCADIRCYC
jgi:anaphase-promoting complex subunit 1